MVAEDAPATIHPRLLFKAKGVEDFRDLVNKPGTVHVSRNAGSQPLRPAPRIAATWLSA